MNDQKRLERIALAIVDQEAARIAIPANRAESGFWFGGGNAVVGPEGALYIVGRYRNAGDSRTGLKMGERGLELAVFRRNDPWNRDGAFEKVLSLSKADLSHGDLDVLSIEGTSLYYDRGTWELYLSTEKAGLPYPPGLEEFQKPGTGVWSINRLRAANPESLAQAPLEPILRGTTAEHWHVKDPTLHVLPNGDQVLFFCTHPFGWSSSNSSLMIRPRDSKDFGEPSFGYFRRGFTWDVAVSRISDALFLDEARLGLDESVSIIFYDGAECMRNHDANVHAVSRPRGYSCEEIAGLAAFSGSDPRTAERISTTGALFTSPQGTGSCRYIHATTDERGVIATWQQAQADGSQPLVIRTISWEELAALS